MKNRSVLEIAVICCLCAVAVTSLLNSAGKSNCLAQPANNTTSGNITMGNGNKTADLAGTGGVALIEYAKDSIQTTTSNVSSAMANQTQMRKVVERKINGQ